MKINAADNAPLMSEWTFPEHPAFCSKAGITAAEEQFCPSAFFCMTACPGARAEIMWRKKASVRMKNPGGMRCFPV